MKSCNKCHESKPFDQFQKDRTKRDGYKNQCKPCTPSRAGQPRSKTSKAAEPPKVDPILSQARQMALKKLVENHPVEFHRLVSRFGQSLGVPPQWRSLS